MTIFNCYYHNLKHKPNTTHSHQLLDLNNDDALERCSEAYQGMAHDLELVFAAEGILEQMSKDQSYWSYIAKGKINAMTSPLLRDSFLKIYKPEFRAKSKDHLKNSLAQFLEYSQNYVKMNRVSNDANDKDKFRASILKNEKIVIKYSSECLKQIDLVDFLIQFAPFVDDAEVIFEKEGLMDSLTDAINEIASDQEFEAETLIKARHTITAQSGKLKTDELIKIIGQTCRSTLNINKTDQRNVFQELASEACWLSSILKNWYITFSKNSKIQTLKNVGNLNMPRVVTPAEWLKTAVLKLIVRHSVLMNTSSNTSKLYDASEKLRLVYNFKFSDLSPSRWPLYIRSRILGNTVLMQSPSQQVVSSSSSSSSQTIVPNIDDFFNSMADAIADLNHQNQPKPNILKI